MVTSRRKYSYAKDSKTFLTWEKLRRRKKKNSEAGKTWSVCRSEKGRSENPINASLNWNRQKRGEKREETKED